MREFIIKIAITAGTVVVLGCSALGVKSCVDSRAIAQKEAKHQKAQADIQAMITICAFKRVDDAEQASINACGDDVVAAKRAIRNIVDSRIIFWDAQLQKEMRRGDKLIDVKKEASYWSESNERQYREVAKSIVKDIEVAEGQQKFWGATLKKLDGNLTTTETGGSKNATIRL